MVILNSRSTCTQQSVKELITLFRNHWKLNNQETCVTTGIFTGLSGAALIWRALTDTGMQISAYTYTWQISLGIEMDANYLYNVCESYYRNTGNYNTCGIDYGKI